MRKMHLLICETYPEMHRFTRCIKDLPDASNNVPDASRNVTFASCRAATICVSDVSEASGDVPDKI